MNTKQIQTFIAVILMIPPNSNNINKLIFLEKK